MRSRRVLLAAAAVVLAGACTDIDVVFSDPAKGHELVRGHVRIRLTATPQAASAPGTVLVVLTYENLSSKTVVLTSGYGCVSFASVYRGEERIPFPATQYGCTAAVSYRDLEPGVPLTVEWPLAIGGDDGLDVPPGTYRFVAELNTHAENLERTFVIQ